VGMRSNIHVQLFHGSVCRMGWIKLVTAVGPSIEILVFTFYSKR
jgi:hypothetical protein